MYRLSPSLEYSILITMNSAQLGVNKKHLAKVCQKWGITELFLFGSSLLNQAAARDIDLLVSFENGNKITLLDYDSIEDDLSALFGKKVDLISKNGIEHSSNAFIRQSILSSAERLYGSKDS